MQMCRWIFSDNRYRLVDRDHFIFWLNYFLPCIAYISLLQCSLGLVKEFALFCSRQHQINHGTFYIMHS